MTRFTNHINFGSPLFLRGLILSNTRCPVSSYIMPQNLICVKQVSEIWGAELFPHLTVWDNVAFGLKMNRTPKKQIEKKVKSALKTAHLTGFEDRYPAQLSGGQQQRVAIARGIVMDHKILLLDESLASLDLKLKREMQTELKKLQRKLGMTFVYVTHDQDEALTMSDRIAIMNAGRIIQLGTPEEIYAHPKNDFVKSFISDIDLINFKKTRLKRYHEPTQSWDCWGFCL